ncbi:MAG: hypothetical protein NVSMB2_14140 [Chloroflexota bacterium]
MAVTLMDVRETFSREEHQTHRRLAFEVPAGTADLWIEVQYAPKWVTGDVALEIAQRAAEGQARAFGEVVGPEVVEAWLRDVLGGLTDGRVANLVTVSLDDSVGRYRGAGHRHDARQRLVIGDAQASAGLVAGAVLPGVWWLTVSAHTVVSNHVSVSIKIGAGRPSW